MPFRYRSLFFSAMLAGFLSNQAALAGGDVIAQSDPALRQESSAQGFSPPVSHQTTENYFQKAVTHVRAGQLQQAVAMLSRVLSRDPGHEKARILLMAIVSEVREAAAGPAAGGMDDLHLPPARLQKILAAAGVSTPEQEPSIEAGPKSAATPAEQNSDPAKADPIDAAVMVLRRILDVDPGHRGAQKLLEELEAAEP